MGKWCLRASSFIFDWIVIKVAGNQDRHKARTSLIWGLWFPWPIYMFFEMRFYLGILDSGERSLPFGLLVFYTRYMRRSKGWSSMGQSPHRQSENDLWPPMTPIILSIPRFGHRAIPTPHINCHCLRLASFREKSLFRPSCQGPSRPGRICTEPSRAGVRCYGPTFQGVIFEGRIVIGQIVQKRIVQGLMVQDRCVCTSVYAEPSCRGPICQNQAFQILNTGKISVGRQFMSWYDV